jgi:hypothetical protein
MDEYTTQVKFLVGVHDWTPETERMFEAMSTGGRRHYVRGVALSKVQESGTALGVPVQVDPNASWHEVVEVAAALYQEPLLDETTAMRESGVPLRESESRQLREAGPAAPDEVFDALVMRECGVPIRGPVADLEVQPPTVNEALADAGLLREAKPVSVKHAGMSEAAQLLVALREGAGTAAPTIEAPECPTCDGTGAEDGGPCPDCKGSGLLADVHQTPTGVNTGEPRAKRGRQRISHDSVVGDRHASPPGGRDTPSSLNNPELRESGDDSAAFQHAYATARGPRDPEGGSVHREMSPEAALLDSGIPLKA